MDRDQLIGYFLRRMPEEARLELAERCVVDPDFHQQLVADEAELFDAYVRGELTEDDRQAIETHLLASPAQRSKLAFAYALESALSRRVTPREWARWAIPVAASIALTALPSAALLWRENNTLRTRLAAHSAPTPMSAGDLAAVMIAAGTLRSAVAGPIVTMGAGVEIVRLDLELENGDEAGDHSLEVAARGDVIWREGPVRSVRRGGLNAVPVWIPSHVLSPGRYEVRLTGPANTVLYYNLQIASP